MSCEACASSQCDPEVQRTIALSPWLAYAMAIGVPLDPYPLTITADFSAAGNPDPILEQTPGDDPLNRDFLIEEFDVDIQTTGAGSNAGSIFKPQQDIFYDQTSGIQVAIKRRGLYGKFYDQIPLKALPKMVSRKRPMPLLADQTLLMDFFVTTPLPAAATNITVSILARSATKDFVFKSDINAIFDCLDKMGYDTVWPRKLFLSAT
jgi:hypothetical protein